MSIKECGGAEFGNAICKADRLKRGAGGKRARGDLVGNAPQIDRGEKIAVLEAVCAKLCHPAQVDIVKLFAAGKGVITKFLQRSVELKRLEPRGKVKSAIAKVGEITLEINRLKG